MLEIRRLLRNARLHFGITRGNNLARYRQRCKNWIITPESTYVISIFSVNKSIRNDPGRKFKNYNGRLRRNWSLIFFIERINTLRSPFASKQWERIVFLKKPWKFYFLFIPVFSHHYTDASASFSNNFTACRMANFITRRLSAGWFNAPSHVNLRETTRCKEHRLSIPRISTILRPGHSGGF